MSMTGKNTLDALFAHDMCGVAGGEDGNRLFLEEIFQAADMVAVFVGEEDGGEGIRIDAELRESQAELLRAESGIDQDAHASACDNGGVTCGTGAEDSEFHRLTHGGISLGRLSRHPLSSGKRGGARH